MSLFFQQYIILVVDSTDRERLSISMEELHKMLGHEELSKAAILVFANKQVRDDSCRKYPAFPLDISILKY